MQMHYMAFNGVLKLTNYFLKTFFSDLFGHSKSSFICGTCLMSLPLSWQVLDENELFCLELLHIVTDGVILTKKSKIQL